MVEHLKLSRRRLVIGFILSLLIVGLLVVVLDWRSVGQILGKTDWRLVLVALFFTAASYVCLGISFAVASRVFDIRMRLRDLSAIGFVTANLNYVLSSAGAAGLSVRFLLMLDQGTTARDIVAASLFDGYVNGLGLLALLAVGLGYLFLNHPLSPAASVATGITAGLLVAILLLATALVFVGSLRTAMLRALATAARRLVRRDLTATMSDFDATMSRGVIVMQGQPLLLVLLIALALADWAVSAAALWFCFDALGEPISVAVLLTGFGVGVTAGTLSLVPGGLGVQEGSMAGVYALLGVPLQQAILASILFRIVYYIIPFLGSLAFYWWLLRRVARPEMKSRVLEEQ
jgi:glycosyltransferase 2 family protein